MDFSTIQPIVNVAVPLAVTALIGWLVKEAVKLVPALGSFLTAARVTAAENALSNIIVSKSGDILSGKTTVQAEAKAAAATLSVAAKTAMSAQGTTEDMMIARAAGNALVKLGTVTPAPVIVTPTVKATP